MRGEDSVPRELLYMEEHTLLVPGTRSHTGRPLGAVVQLSMDIPAHPYNVTMGPTKHCFIGRIASPGQCYAGVNDPLYTNCHICESLGHFLIVSKTLL